jgi:hypothetical protein
MDTVENALVGHASRTPFPSQIPSLMKRCWGMRVVHPPLHKPHPPPLDLPAPPTNLLPALTIFHTSAACTCTYQHDHDHDHLYHERLLMPNWRLLRQGPKQGTGYSRCMTDGDWLVQEMCEEKRLLGRAMTYVSLCLFHFILLYLETNNSDFFCSQINHTTRTCNRSCGCGRKALWCNKDIQSKHN